ncbi:GntR family transcriptional regulator [Streptomyces anulatus]|uniref:GntR family transcriptional regulator n=1 Tax=Streptomyces anulatus TaxID=1892 RepID=UPI00386EB88A
MAPAPAMFGGLYTPGPRADGWLLPRGRLPSIRGPDMSGNRRLRYSPEHVYADLRERITDGRWPPGRVLTYADIQQLYGVSRETVATALARLREAGLVETRRMGTRPKVVGESWRLATGTSIQDDITRHVRKLVTEGVYGPGDRIPSLMALAAEHSVSVATVRRAIRPLLHEGVLVTVRPRGTFVADRRTDGPSDAR